MKNLLKYMIPIVMIAVLSCVAGRLESSSHQDALSNTVSFKNPAFSELLSSSDPDSSIPRQIIADTNNPQPNARKTENTHARPFVELAKSGKAHNLPVVCSVQRKSVTINTSIVEHSHKLVCLGKLVI